MVASSRPMSPARRTRILARPGQARLAQALLAAGLLALIARPAPATPATAAAAAAPDTASATNRWESLPRLVDVRYDGASTLTPALAEAGHARLELPWSLNVDGMPCRHVDVGPGWIRLMPQAPARARLDGPLDGQADGRGASTPDLGPRHFDILPAGLGTVDASSSVIALVRADGFAVRWSAISTPAGPATFEILADRQGRLTVQYLRVPPGMNGAMAGASGAPLSVRGASASSLLLGERAVLVPPRLPSVPHHSGPPPVDCNPETGTWCDRADGPGTSEVWLAETFDDGGSQARGWSGTGLWHESDFTNCTPGASSDPGQSWYFGVDGACAYTSRSTGRLRSPTFGPISLGTVFTFSSRIDHEGPPFDIAQIFVNGASIGAMPTGLNPALWYNFDPIPLDGWAGQMVTIEFDFAADQLVNLLGWFVDDVVVWNPNVGNPDCIRNAGRAGAAPCDERQSTSWTFNESQFCTGCIYTFYVLVECGREMHLPLEDMEGADIRITNVEFPGTPPQLRCVNSTARADAGEGDYLGTPLPSETGGLLDCCPPAGAEVWYGPPFDVTDSAGPGHVTWGLAAGCPSILVYDSSLPQDGLFSCADVSPSCGQLDLLSPGENQVMDCFITNDAGLCGLYRVDVISGGNVWTLFANCDGTNTPQFPIFFDCTEAWTAYNPLPELAVANLVITANCPDLVVDFDIINIGCAPHLGDVVARISASAADASCALPPVEIDIDVSGPFPPGATVHVTQAITAACTPTRVDVTADPFDVIAECTETPGAAACRAEAGVDTLTAFTCGCAAQLAASAGTDQAGCVSEIIRLDASGSAITGCATQPLYRWLDAGGAVLRDWSPSATHDVSVRCPAGATYTVEIACEGEPCVNSDSVTITCIEIMPAAGDDTLACAGGPLVLDGSASAITNCATPIYRWIDGAGAEVRGWTTNPTLSVPSFNCAAAGDWLLEVGCQGETCTDYDFVTVTCVQALAEAGPDLVACEGIPVTISGAGATLVACNTALYQWYDLGGTPVSAVLTDPLFELTLTGCPGVATLVLVSACVDPDVGDCVTFDLVEIDCGNPQVPVPVATPTCSGASVDCGAAEAGVTYWWDADITVDSDLDGDPANDADLASCAGSIPYPDEAARTARAWAQDALGCRALADVAASALAPPAAPAPSAEPACPGARSTLRCGSAEPGVSWDFDVLVDSDGDTVADNDSDAATCEASAPYPAGSYTARVTVTSAGGCTASATVSFDVLATTAPPEVQGDRVTRTGARLEMTWDATPGASTYRVARGTIGTWYDHATDIGRGSCDTLGLTGFADPDDATDGANWYYLVTAVEPCGLEGSPGQGTNGQAPFDRPARIPTAACP